MSLPVPTGTIKLSRALSGFRIVVAGAVALDLGAHSAGAVSRRSVVRFVDDGFASVWIGSACG